MSIGPIIDKVLWLVIRFFKKRDEPEAVRKREQGEIDQAIVTHDADALNLSITDNLRRLQNKGRGGAE